jgi:transglutaminase-like putative cysteine protease
MLGPQNELRVRIWAGAAEGAAVGVAVLPTSVRTHTFPSGYPTTKGTIDLLVRHIVEDSRKPRLRARVRELFRDLPQLDVEGELRAVWDFVLSHVRYMRDVLGTEHITYPDELDREVDDGTAAEDCESIAAYAAALLAAAGHASRLVIIGRRPDQPKRFSHCYLEVENYRTGQWIPFDTVGALEHGLALGQAVSWPGPIERFDLDGRKVLVMSGYDLRGCLCRDGGDGGSLRGALLGDALEDFQKGWADVHELLRPIAEGIAEYVPVVKPFVQAGDTIEQFGTGKKTATQAVAELKRELGAGGAAGAKKTNILPPPPAGKKPYTPPPPKKDAGSGTGTAVAAGGILALIAAAAGV